MDDDRALVGLVGVVANRIDYLVGSKACPTRLTEEAEFPFARSGTDSHTWSRFLSRYPLPLRGLYFQTRVARTHDRAVLDVEFYALDWALPLDGYLSSGGLTVSFR